MGGKHKNSERFWFPFNLPLLEWTNGSDNQKLYPINADPTALAGGIGSLAMDIRGNLWIKGASGWHEIFGTWSQVAASSLSGNWTIDCLNGRRIEVTGGDLPAGVVIQIPTNWDFDFIVEIDFLLAQANPPTFAAGAFVHRGAKPQHSLGRVLYTLEKLGTNILLCGERLELDGW